MKLRVLLTEDEVKKIIKQHIRNTLDATGRIVVSKTDGDFAYRVGFYEEL